MDTQAIQKIKNDIGNLKRFWSKRNLKFKDWYEMLILIDTLEAKGLESYASNEPQTFYNMAHYLLTKGEISHTAPIENENAAELDRRARIDRGCRYMWKSIDDERMEGGNQALIDELSFYLLVLGWYSVPLYYDRETGFLKAQVWNPYDTYPKYSNNKLSSLTHSYLVSEEEAEIKANNNSWFYKPQGTATGYTTLDDYFVRIGDEFYNMVLVNGEPVTGLIPRPEMKLLTGAVGGFPDRGSLMGSKGDWRAISGRGIFEVNEQVTLAFNKWKTMLSQILRDTAQPVTQEFSTTPQATPDQLRQRGALFHYTPGEGGLHRVPPPAIPIELQASLMEIRREIQKGSFSDAVYGMMEGQSGYALSLLASSSANQILYPYMDAKHFIISQADKFWLSNLKSNNRTFSIQGRMVEKLKPKDIPENVDIIVESEVATPKDWMEKGTIGGMLRQDVDDATLLGEIYGFSDPQAIIRRRRMDNVLNHPMSINIEMISGYTKHADYLERRGDIKKANLFRRAAKALESQLGAPEPGQGLPPQATRIQSQREEGTPEEKANVQANMMPPEARGFTPQELRRMIGSGSVKGV